MDDRSWRRGKSGLWNLLAAPPAHLLFLSCFDLGILKFTSPIVLNVDSHSFTSHSLTLSLTLFLSLYPQLLIHSLTISSVNTILPTILQSLSVGGFSVLFLFVLLTHLKPKRPHKETLNSSKQKQNKAQQNSQYNPNINRQDFWFSNFGTTN